MMKVTMVADGARAGQYLIRVNVPLPWRMLADRVLGYRHLFLVNAISYTWEILDYDKEGHIEIAGRYRPKIDDYVSWV
jgi:hypothetical protein